MQAVKQAEIERERALRQTVVSKAERAAIEEKYRTDIEKAEKDHNDKLEDMARETAAIQYEATLIERIDGVVSDAQAIRGLKH